MAIDLKDLKDLQDPEAKKAHDAFKARSLCIIADEIEDLFPLQANALRNMSRDSLLN